ncbi:MAG: MFS transporter [Bacillota bacterium]|nr:MFS transporter [Bacillota bacterium]
MNKQTKTVMSFIAIILGFFMALLDSTIVNIALPEMSKHYGASVENISWVVNGYNLAFAVFIITAARLADQFGRKKIFLIGVFLFTLASLLCGISPNVETLIVLRVIQGLAGAIVVPVTVPLAMELFPREKHGLVIGLWGAISGLAAASGPALGGILTDKFNWQSIFFVNVPLGVITLVLTTVLIKESYDGTATKRIDWGGMASITAAMFCITYALIKSNDFGWGSYKTISLFATGFIALILFFVIEVKSKKPMLPVSLLKIPYFDGAALTLFAVGAGIMNASFLMSFFLTQIMGKTVLQAGLTIAVMPLVSMVFSSVAGPLSNKFGSRWFAAAGMSAIIFSIYLFSMLDSNSSQIDIMWRLAVTGMGLGMTMAPVMSASVRNVPKEKIGMSSGITNMTRALGAVLGVAIIVTVLNANTTNEIEKTKNNIITMINSDNVFNSQFKQNLLSQIKNTTVSRDSKRATLDQIIANIDLQEKSALSKATLAKAPAPQINKIRTSFESQKSETRKVYPTIETSFKSGITKAFSNTFKISSLILLIGILFALFSDRARRKPEELSLQMQE